MRTLLHRYPGIIGGLIGLAVSALLVDLDADLQVAEIAPDERLLTSEQPAPVFADRLDYGGHLVAALEPAEKTKTDEAATTPRDTVREPETMPAAQPTVIAERELPPVRIIAAVGTPLAPLDDTDGKPQSDTPSVAEPDGTTKSPVKKSAVAGWIGTETDDHLQGLRSKPSMPLALTPPAADSSRDAAEEMRMKAQSRPRTVTGSERQADAPKSPLAPKVILNADKGAGCVWLLHTGAPQLTCL